MKIKKKFKLLFVVVLIFALVFLPFVSKKTTFSDSGFDYSYDSGGSSSSSHSSHSSHSRSSSSGSSSGEDNPLAALGTVVYITILFIMIGTSPLLKEYNSRIANPAYLENKDKEMEEYIKKYIPSFDKEQFIKECYGIYIDVQNAWMNFTLENVKNVLTNELYAQYESQLSTLEAKGEQNIMEDFEFIKAYITNASIENDTIEVTTRFVIKFKDYIVDQTTKEVKRGNKDRISEVTYEMSFRKELKQNSGTIKCPNCGADVEIDTTSTCPYCHTQLVIESSNWVLTQKRSIRQS